MCYMYVAAASEPTPATVVLLQAPRSSHGRPISFQISISSTTINAAFIRDVYCGRGSCSVRPITNDFALGTLGRELS